MIDHLFVHIDDGGRGTQLVGEVYFTIRGGRLLSSTFHYENEWLANRASFSVDPGLELVSGPQNISGGLPRAMQDCSPDRWGRNLLTKKRRAEAQAAKQPVPTLTDVDFLAGVSDFTRQGALRLTTDNGDESPFLAASMDVPKLIELPRLMRAADAVSRGDDFASIKVLLDAGSGSLGGARPKASVRDGTRLLIAKFPHPQDGWDVMAWEKAALDLAASAGIRVPETRRVEIDGSSVLLLARFDRQEYRHVPYVSAMTLLQAYDGDPHDYVEVAEALPEVSSAASADLEELWRRIAFSIMVNNTDDHLRNHGFLYEPGGWRLSPAFDMNPNPLAGVDRQTGIGGVYQRREAIEALRGYADAFRVGTARGEQILDEVASAVAGWREVAAGLGIKGEEIEFFGYAFSPVSAPG